MNSMRHRPPQGFCQNCGSQLPAQLQIGADDSGSYGWLVLGFLVPILGCVLYTAWRKRKPRCAQRIAIGALFGYSLAFVMRIAASLFSLTFLVGSLLLLP